jgi:hypothetical protein
MHLFSPRSARHRGKHSLGRHRTTRAKGCLSHDTGMIMVFKLIQTAQSSWRGLDGQNQLPKLITGVKFTDGIEAGRENAAA